MPKRITYGILLLCLVEVTMAQQSHVLYFMEGTPQVNFVNPAMAPECKTHIGIPGLSSIQVNYNNTAFALKDAFYPERQNDSLLVNYDNIVSSIHGKEMVTNEVVATLFNVGHHFNNAYVNFSVTEKQQSYSILGENDVRLAWYGNTQFRGETVDLGTSRTNFLHYREYALGASRDLSDRFRLGVKAKVLFGKANVFTAKAKGSIFTDEDNFGILVNVDAGLNVDMPIVITTDSTGIVTNIDFQDDINPVEYLLNRKNLGVAFDLGFNYDVNDRLQISGSLLNLGVIRWRTNPYVLTAKGEVENYGSGRENTVSYDGSLTNLLDSVMQSLSVYPEQKNYFSTLAPEIYLGATYALLPKVNAGLLFYSPVYRWRVLPSLFMSLNAEILEGLYGSVAYTVQNGAYDNLGAGLSMKLGALHLHMMSDNITGLMYWDDTRNINVRMGASLLLGCSKKKRQRTRIQQDCDCVGDPYDEHRWDGRPNPRRRR